MIILVLGNGFDLAHDLPTKYSHFLDFIKMYKDVEQKELTSDYEKEVQKKVDKLKMRNDRIAIEMQDIFMHHNRLMDHFLDVYTERCIEGKDGWIDFESEIADIVKTFDEACKYVKDKTEKNDDCTLPDYVYFKLAPFVFGDRDYPKDKLYKFHSEFLEEQAKCLLNDLNRITRLFEIYLYEYVEGIDTKLRIPEIYKIEKKNRCCVKF